eukprot:SAG11_NODE_4464_length_1886_cov_2.049804_3_plen_124_part_01
MRSARLLIIMWVFANFGLLLFRSNDPLHFGSLHIALFTLFRVATLEDWTDVMYVNIYGCGETSYGYPFKADRGNRNLLTGFNVTVSDYYTPCTKPRALGLAAAAYFITYVLMTAMIALSVFVGV